MLTVQQNLKENGFKVIKSMRNNVCYSSICYNLFPASQRFCQASKNHELLARHVKLVLKLKLLPVNILQPPLLISLPKSLPVLGSLRACF